MMKKDWKDWWRGELLRKDMNWMKEKMKEGKKKEKGNGEDLRIVKVIKKRKKNIDNGKKC